MSVAFTARAACFSAKVAPGPRAVPIILTNNHNAARILDFLVYPQIDPVTGNVPTRERPALLDAVDFLASIILARYYHDDFLYLTERLAQLQDLADYAILHGYLITWHYDF